MSQSYSDDIQPYNTIPIEKLLLALRLKKKKGKVKKTTAIKGIQKKRYAQFNKISSSSVNSLKYLENSICSYPHDNIQNALRILNTFEPSLWLPMMPGGQFQVTTQNSQLISHY